MADVNVQLQRIMTAVYGEEVRSSIHDAISAMNEESSAAMEYAATAQDSAQASASAAAASESAAATAASNAANSATAAESSKNAIIQKVTEASASATAAAASATNAAASATDAESSKNTASQKASEASASASAASTSETNAASSETNAAASETNAEAYKNTAVQKASEAAASATAAADSEDAVTEMQTTIESLYSQIQTIKGLIDAAQADVEAMQTAVNASATAAAESEANAESYKDTAASSLFLAVAAKDDAQTAAQSAMQYSGRPPRPDTTTHTWWVWDANRNAYVDTHIGSEIAGPQGNGIDSITLVSGTHAAGTNDTYRVAFTDGSHFDLVVYNGADGTGSVLSVAGKTGAVELTASDVGLGNVPNVATNDQAVTYTEALQNEELVSGENASTAFGKLAKIVSSFIAHLSASNPHNIDKSAIGLGNVDNTADADKNVLYATTAGSAPASDVSAWAKAANKPTYTASEVGLGNVPNVATNDQTPTFTQYTGEAQGAIISSGETLSTIFGKLKRMCSDLFTHLRASNPHGITKSTIGLGNVDNTADSAKSVLYAETAGSAPASDVSAWAKAANKPSYTASEVGAAASGHTHTAAAVGAAAASHAHGNITSDGKVGSTSGVALVTTTNGAVTTRNIADNTTGALGTNTYLITERTVRYHSNRTTGANQADANYSTYMFRGEALNSSDTNPSYNGQISWTYS